MSLYPVCERCGEPATFEVRGNWGDVWEQACDDHKGQAALRVLNVLAQDGTITVRDLVPRAAPPRRRKK